MTTFAKIAFQSIDENIPTCRGVDGLEQNEEFVLRRWESAPASPKKSPKQKVKHIDTTTSLDNSNNTIDKHSNNSNNETFEDASSRWDSTPKACLRRPRQLNRSSSHFVASRLCNTNIPLRLPSDHTKISMEGSLSMSKSWHGSTSSLNGSSSFANASTSSLLNANGSFNHNNNGSFIYGQSLHASIHAKSSFPMEPTKEEEEASILDSMMEEEDSSCIESMMGESSTEESRDHIEVEYCLGDTHSIISQDDDDKEFLFEGIESTIQQQGPKITLVIHDDNHYSQRQLDVGDLASTTAQEEEPEEFATRSPSSKRTTVTKKKKKKKRKQPPAVRQKQKEIVLDIVNGALAMHEMDPMYFL